MHSSIRFSPTLAPLALFLILTGCRPAAWSPEKADLIFMSNRDGNAEVYLIAAGDTAWQNLTNHFASDNWPVWSPDGSRIAFHSNRNGALDVFVMNRDGSGLVQVTQNADHDYLPYWTPDGRILFTSWRAESTDTTRAQHLYLISLDGTGEERLNIADGLPAGNGRVSPDGTRIVFGRSLAAQPADVWIADADGSNPVQLTTSDSFDSDPSFSPDGLKISYYADQHGAGVIWTMNLDGSDAAPLIEGGLHYYARWSPDGNWMLTCSASSDGNYDVVARRLDRPEEVRVLAGGPGRECDGAWRPVIVEK